MPTQPTPAEALARLRLDEDLLGDVTSAIGQAHAQAQTYLDGTLYASPAELTAANDSKGIVCTPDIIAAQILLVDVLVGNNDAAARTAKEAAAHAIMRPHRNMGA